MKTKEVSVELNDKTGTYSVVILTREVVVQFVSWDTAMSVKAEEEKAL